MKALRPTTRSELNTIPDRYRHATRIEYISCAISNTKDDAREPRRQQVIFLEPTRNNVLESSGPVSCLRLPLTSRDWNPGACADCGYDAGGRDASSRRIRAGCRWDRSGQAGTMIGHHSRLLRREYLYIIISWSGRSADGDHAAKPEKGDGDWPATGVCCVGGK